MPNPKATMNGGRKSAAKAGLKAFLERLLPAAGPVLAGLGLELAWAGSRLTGGRAVIQLFIDRRPGSAVEAPIGLDDCAAASRALEAEVEAAGWPEEPAGYLLEVSSPGLDRPLFKEDDVRRFQGRMARLKLRQEGGVRVRLGRLGFGETGKPALLTPAGRVDFDWSEVVSARLSLDDPAPGRPLSSLS